MKLTRLLTLAALLISASSAIATSFIVPTDEELIARADRIVTGTVEGMFVQESGGVIETVYELRLERVFRGTEKRGELLRVVSPGGLLAEDRGLIVPAAARYRQGEQVLVFLSRDARGRFQTTDLTLGRFEFATTTDGTRVLVRDLEDVVGWDHAGRPFEETRVRREAAFLAFVELRSQGRRDPVEDYTIDARKVVLGSSREVASDAVLEPEANAPSFPAPTYTDWVSNQPIRWANMSGGVNFYKRTDQDISGAADGGVSAIQSGLAAWNNECGSLINLIYAGERATASANHDGVNVVEYNDPQSRVSGSWTGSGTIAITFLSFAGSHSFAGTTWWNITDADVVFQNGYTATSNAFAPAMTHELGHGIGFRHSNQDYATGGACNSSTQECTSAAIMNSSVSGSYGYTLQPWDQNAAQAVYPGGTCGGSGCVAPSITNEPDSTTVSAGVSTTLSVSATGTAPLSYQWYLGTSGITASPISGATSNSLTVTPGVTSSYWVRVSNACGSDNSATATVTVSTTQPAPGTASGLYLVTPCRVHDSRDANTPIPSGGTQLVQITGRCGIPSGANAVVMNLTAVAPSGNGTLATWPGTGQSSPGTITVAYRTGRTRASNTIMRLSSDGKLAVGNSGVNVHYIIDVSGYFD
jgi:hypothetical protein